MSHFGQNEISSAVNDASYRRDLIPSQTILDRIDNRNSTSDSSLIAQCHTLRLRKFEQLDTMLCQ